MFVKTHRGLVSALYPFAWLMMTTKWASLCALKLTLEPLRHVSGNMRGVRFAPSLKWGHTTNDLLLLHKSNHNLRKLLVGVCR